VDERKVVRDLLKHVLSRVPWHDLQLISVAAVAGGYTPPLSLFIDSNGQLRSCGAPDSGDPSYVGALGFGGYGDREPSSDLFTLDLPRFRSVVTGGSHSLALTQEGEVYLWTDDDTGGPELPTLFQELRGHCVRRVATGLFHSAAVTDRGVLFTWCDYENGGGESFGYPVSEDLMCLCPRRVEALNDVKVVSVAAGWNSVSR
jgi:alpha-tubulin suppressor-like RCC1 family protein